MKTSIHNKESIMQVLQGVKDPEIPVLSVVDMGIITGVELSGGDENQTAVITMTPTFVGCPAIDMMKQQIQDAVKEAGIEKVSVLVDLNTSWNSNLMSEEAKSKLEKFGIAPPPVADGELTTEMLDRVRCPHCGSTDTTLRSAFGSTLCRAIRFCFSCKQGFEQFKPVL